MNEVWNLDRIYRGYEDPAFCADLQQLRDLAVEYNAFAGKLDSADTLSGLKEGIGWQEKLTALALKLFGYAQLRQSADTRDTRSGSYVGQVMQILSTTAGAEAAWKTWAAKRQDLMVYFEPEAFESIVEKIVVISRNELEFHLIGELKLTERI